MFGMYYGTDADSPRKIYSLDDFQANDKGVGTIDTYFSESSVTRDDLRNIALMGDDLQFEFWHLGHGPLVYQLKRS